MMKEVSDQIKATMRAHRGARRAAEAIPADDSEYSARERAGGNERGGQCGGAAMADRGDAAIRFRAEAALGDWRGAGILDFAGGGQDRGRAVCGVQRAGSAARAGDREFLSRRAHARARLHGNFAAVHREHRFAHGRRPTAEIRGGHVSLEGTDLWLTPTSEVELTSLHRDETLDAETLPIKVCAWTACFRSEAGAAGKDTRGIKRQHQFQKVEMFKFTRPEQSYDELESLVRNAEAVLQKLGCTTAWCSFARRDMGFASAKTYDIEVWLPSTGEFMEISSCSNTEAFQARRSGIRFKPKGGGKSEFVHTLNGRVSPWGGRGSRSWRIISRRTARSMIPEALRPYMGTDRIAAD